MAVSGALLKKIRRQLGFNDQHSFAQKLGVSRVTVSNWERRGDANIPREAERLVRDFAEDQYRVKLTLEGSSKSYSAETASLGALLGYSLGGVVGSALGAAAGAVVGSGSGATSVSLSTKCPWCTERVHVSSVDEEADYVCAECEREFRFRPGRGPIRKATKA